MRTNWGKLEAGKRILKRFSTLHSSKDIEFRYVIVGHNASVIIDLERCLLHKLNYLVLPASECSEKLEPSSTTTHLTKNS